MVYCQLLLQLDNESLAVKRRPLSSLDKPDHTDVQMAGDSIIQLMSHVYNRDEIEFSFQILIKMMKNTVFHFFPYP